MEIFKEAELRRLVTLNEKVLEVIEDGFTRLSRGQVQTPPIMRIEVPEHNGEVDIKAARVQGLGQFAIKVSSGFFDNPARGLRSGSGLMVLLNAETGYPKALLMDNGYLTDVRTAAAGAIAAKYLAPERVNTVGIIGAGSQARWQLRAVRLVRSFQKVLVYSQHRDHAEQFADEMAQDLGITVVVSDSAEALVRQSDVVVTTTPATQPVIQASWVHPGLHITAMGSDAEFKQELDGRILARADKACCDLIAQCRRLGELHHAEEIDPELDNRVMELGDLTAKKLLGRTHPDHVTVCDLTGTGVQDTMIARYAVERAHSVLGSVTPSR